MIEHVLTYTAPAGYALLPEKMRAPKATALLLAIGLQESRFTDRQQIGGPALGFWQFEAPVIGLLIKHPASQALANVLHALCYPPVSSAYTIEGCHAALEHNDTLAFCLARLLLWTLPGALPELGDAEKGWKQYLQGWHPGKPRRETWDAFYTEAWSLVGHGV